MADLMLTELYERAFKTKYEVEEATRETGEAAEHRREIALAKNKLLCELIDIRTDQIRQGRD